MKTKFFYGMAVMTALGLASCSSDNLVNDGPQIVDKDTNFYISVEIANPGGNDTRAENASDYIDGTPDEMKIHEILFVFYNSEKHYVGHSTVKPDNNGGTESGKPGSIETILSITVPVTVNAGSLKPAYVMAYVNPTTGTTDQQRDFASTLGLTRTLDQITPQSDGHKGFTMTNSVYYDDSQSKEPLIAVPIAATQLYTTEEEAEEATEKTIIYVERVVSKVTVTQPGDGIIPQSDNTITDADGTKYSLNFNVLGWGLSNLEKGTFLIKNFRSGSDNAANVVPSTTPATITNLTWQEVSNALSELTDPAWNYPSSSQNEANWNISGHRSFWAYSPTYFTGAEYPSNADQVFYNEITPNLEYLSFDHIYNTENQTITKKGKNLGETMYTLEHTMEAAVVTNHQKRAVTCVLILGQYTFTPTDESSDAKTETFYIRNGIDNEGKPANIFYAGDKQLKKAYLEKNHVIYVKNEEGANPAYSPVPWDVDANLENFKIFHPVPGGSDAVIDSYIPNRYVSMELSTLPTETTYYLQNANGTYDEITDANLAAANKALYENLNGMMSGISKYNNGYAYFSVPIMHLWGRGSNDKQIGENEFEAKLGQYGIVRNHSYNINVTAIQGIGIGIGDPAVPIIPVVETEKYFVKTEMRVQRWRVVPQQDVTLKP